MTNRDEKKSAGYVESVKILDVEKRYRSGPKHYVMIDLSVHSKVISDNDHPLLGLCYPSEMGQSIECVHHLSTLCPIL